MNLTSPVFKTGQSIPSIYTCDGSDTNPPLTIADVPAAAQSLVLIMEDPDVPSYIREDNMWNHWLVWNIPTEITSIAEAEEPNGVHGTGTAGNLGYHGPCPPDSQHRYFFKLYALDCLLDVPERSTKAGLLLAMDGHVIDTAELMGVYTRVK